MRHLSPSSTQVIMTVLAADGVTVTPERLTEALNVLLGENQPSDPLALRDGERVLIIQGRADDCYACTVDEFNTVEEAHSHVVGLAAEGKQRGWNNEDYTDDDFELVFVRRMTNVKIETEPKVTFQ